MENLISALHADISVIGTLKTFRKGARMLDMGMPIAHLYLVVKGRVIMTKNFRNSKKRHICHIMYPGEFVGIGEIFSKEKTSRMSAFALGEEVRAWKIPYFKFELELRQNSNLVDCIILQFIKKRQEIWKRYQRKRSLSSPDVIIEFLKDIAKERGVAENGWIVAQGFTHSELGAYIGICRQSITQTLNSLKKENLIKYNRSEFLINPKLLQK
ncbi:MAG TPA: Crp/Fnr family transcriptional regulator [Bacteroidetes bacterium]|nr:Crp/Fnr family transcriptional regulator [Bacteroidota bacterium]